MKELIRERGIVVRDNMVRALLDGQKTQARRVIHPQPSPGCYYVVNGAQTHALQFGNERPHNSPNPLCVPPTPTSKDHRLPCPYGKLGDRLWVKEPWCLNHPEIDPQPPLDGRPSRHGRTCWYAATEPGVEGEDNKSPWLSAASMPRWASRILLEITELRVQQVQDISNSDALAEGAAKISEPRRKAGTTFYQGLDGGFYPLANDAFAMLWDVNHWGRKNQRWRENPWVWVLEFKRITSEPQQASGEK